MSRYNQVVYGGVFDPVTNGHKHIIEKASKIFDKVFIVIAENPNKIAMFSLKEREDMLSNIVADIPNVYIYSLPKHLYLVDFARTLGAKFLVRGIRDTIDFPYEQNIYRTNRQINSEVETIYLMPDEQYSLVSSSWVKGLVGMCNWRKQIENHVSPCVLNYLEEKYVEKFAKTIFTSLPINPTLFDSLIMKIHRGYRNKSYHGYDHLIDGIESFQTLGIDIKAEMYFAWLMHDIADTEEGSVEISNSFLSNKYIESLILATKHTTDTYSTRDEKIIASIDLLILSSDKYEEYVKKVYHEYLEKSGDTEEIFSPKWIKGRSEFLTKMLGRFKIYPWDVISDKYLRWTTLETLARQNMERELITLKG